MYCFRGDVGDVCYELLQIPAGLLQVGGINDDLHQLQREGHTVLDEMSKSFGLRGMRAGLECVATSVSPM